MAGQYGAPKPAAGEAGQPGHEHGYEWEQAREEERMARSQAPPGYDLGTSESDGMRKQQRQAGDPVDWG